TLRRVPRERSIWTRENLATSPSSELICRMKYFALVWSSLKRKKTRTILTLLSIFVAFLLYGLLCAVKEAFTAGVTMAGANRLIVRHKVSLIMNVPASYGPRMERIPGVASVLH